MNEWISVEDRLPDGNMNTELSRKLLLENAKPILFNAIMVNAIMDGRKTETRRVVKPQTSDTEVFSQKAPYRSGDFLYVRETWAPLYPNDTSNEVVAYMYKANFLKNVEEYDKLYSDGENFTWEGRWHPSIHMPKEAARLFLQVIDVRVERLQAITMSGMKSEGVIPPTVTGGQWQQWQHDYMQPIWDSTVELKDRDKYGWAANPWVWVLKFRRLENISK